MKWLHDNRDKIVTALAAGDRASARKVLDQTIRVLRENISGERVSGESSFSDLQDEVYDDAAADLGYLRETWDELDNDVIAAWLRRMTMGSR